MRLSTNFGQEKRTIRCLVDVRSQPYSRYNPQFNCETLAATLRNTGLHYLDLGASLGGRPNQPDLYDPGEERPSYSLVLVGVAYEHQPELAPTHEILDTYRQDQDWSTDLSKFRPLMVQRTIQALGEVIFQPHR